MHRPVRPIGGRCADGTIGPVGHIPQLAGPIARLAQQLIPRDGRIVLGTEELGALGRRQLAVFQIARLQSLDADRKSVV